MSAVARSYAPVVTALPADHSRLWAARQQVSAAELTAPLSATAPSR